jgi:hypothetical protein
MELRMSENITQMLQNENARLKAQVAELQAFKTRVEELFPTQVSFGPRYWREKLQEELHLEKILHRPVR